MNRLREVVAKEVSAVRQLPWTRFSKLFSSFLVYFVVMFLSLLVVFGLFVLLIPAQLMTADTERVVGYLFATQALVLLTWIIIAWFIGTSLGGIVVLVLSERPSLGVVAEGGRSIARVATWTGRLGLPVLLASIVFWVLSSDVTASVVPGQASIIRQIAVLQVGLLLLSLTVVLAFESVAVIFRVAGRLPWTVRIGSSVLFPTVGWLAARRVGPLYPTAEHVFVSIAPPTLAGVPRAELVDAIRDNVIYVPWQTGVVGVVLTVAVLTAVEVVKLRADAADGVPVAAQAVSKT